MVAGGISRIDGIADGPIDKTNAPFVDFLGVCTVRRVQLCGYREAARTEDMLQSRPGLHRSSDKSGHACGPSAVRPKWLIQAEVPRRHCQLAFPKRSRYNLSS